MSDLGRYSTKESVFESVTENDEDETIMSEAAHAMRRSLFIVGLLVAFIGLVLTVIFFVLPGFAFSNIQMGLLSASLLFTGLALIFGSILHSPRNKGWGYFLFRFRPITKLFLFSVLAAGTMWFLYFFLLRLNTIDYAVIGAVAFSVILVLMETRRRKLQESLKV